MRSEPSESGLAALPAPPPAHPPHGHPRRLLGGFLSMVHVAWVDAQALAGAAAALLPLVASRPAGLRARRGRTAVALLPEKPERTAAQP